MLITEHDYSTKCDLDRSQLKGNVHFFHVKICHRCHKFWGIMQLACQLNGCPPPRYVGQMAGSQYGVRLASTLLMSVLWEEWRWWWWGAYGMKWTHSDDNHACCLAIQSLPLPHVAAWYSIARICITFQFLNGHPKQVTRLVWDALYWWVRQQVPVPADVQQLHNATEQEGTNISKTTVNNLINSTRRRCVALCEANAGQTRYWQVLCLRP